MERDVQAFGQGQKAWFPGLRLAAGQGGHGSERQAGFGKALQQQAVQFIRRAAAPAPQPGHQFQHQASAWR
ncbi:hypothetical protein D3C81_1955020 [compost metagenome]